MRLGIVVCVLTLLLTVPLVSALTPTMVALALSHRTDTAAWCNVGPDPSQCQ